MERIGHSEKARKWLLLIFFFFFSFGVYSSAENRLCRSLS